MAQSPPFRIQHNTFEALNEFCRIHHLKRTEVLSAAVIHWLETKAPRYNDTEKLKSIIREYKDDIIYQQFTKEKRKDYEYDSMLKDLSKMMLSQTISTSDIRERFTKYASAKYNNGHKHFLPFLNISIAEYEKLRAEWHWFAMSNRWVYEAVDYSRTVNPHFIDMLVDNKIIKKSRISKEELGKGYNDGQILQIENDNE
jgi:hypothetical protein